MKNNANGNKHNTQTLLFPRKTYNFGASGTGTYYFYHMYLYVQVVLQRVNFLTHQKISSKNMDPDT